ncbi:MAG: HAD-IA family hydrolase, partial [Candidatus Promineifilaceae bacterium]|nr:HAD-IA family hydrolase [Candidatus Promineifilaceae bacterium]
IGFSRETCYLQLASAAHLINRGATFVGTNPDVTFPSEVGPLPGAGSLLALVSTATGKEPVVIGKPNQPMFEEAMRRLGGTREDTIMIGDRLNTDISGAQAAGLRAALLLTGITSRDQVDRAAVTPDWIFEDLPQLVDFLGSAGNDR